MNAGGKLGQLSACLVLDVEDNVDNIMETAWHTAKIFQSGGGVGINYSKIRQGGEMVASTFGVASGPVSFMNIVNTITEVIKQGGKRRGANMGIMEVWHPDIEKFITKKMEPGELENFNVSVGVWEDFWDALEAGEEYYVLRDPRNQKVVGRINLHHLVDVIAHSAWESGEPGLLFFDRINQYNVFAKARNAPLRATNPCVTAGHAGVNETRTAKDRRHVGGLHTLVNTMLRKSPVRLQCRSSFHQVWYSWPLVALPSPIPWFQGLPCVHRGWFVLSQDV